MTQNSRPSPKGEAPSSPFSVGQLVRITHGRYQGRSATITSSLIPFRPAPGPPMTTQAGDWVHELSLNPNGEPAPRDTILACPPAWLKPIPPN
jgi:hypothetical protein